MHTLAFFEFCAVIILISNMLLFRLYNNYFFSSGVILLLLYVLLTYALMVNNTLQSIIWYFILPIVTSFLIGFRRLIWANSILLVTFILLVHDIEKRSPENINVFLLVVAFILILFTSTLHEYTRYIAIQEAHNLTITDFLTGAYNRRYFDLELRSAIKSSLRNNLQLSLIVFDIDHFKKINDTLGHKAGDSALKDLVVLFTEHFRSSDKLYRIGGEEFALFTHLDIEGAKKMMCRFMSLLSEKQVDKGYRYTISVGITELKKNDDEDSLLHRADTEMYRAKKSGRNKICSSSS